MSFEIISEILLIKFIFRILQRFRDSITILEDFLMEYSNIPKSTKHKTSSKSIMK